MMGSNGKTSEFLAPTFRCCLGCARSGRGAWCPLLMAADPREWHWPSAGVRNCSCLLTGQPRERGCLARLLSLQGCQPPASQVVLCACVCWPRSPGPPLGARSPCPCSASQPGVVPAGDHRRGDLAGSRPLLVFAPGSMDFLSLALFFWVSSAQTGGSQP